MSKEDKLGSFLQEVSCWRWDEFVRAEHDKSYSSNQAIIFALVRACAMQKLAAIKVAVDRLDGKLKTPVRIEMPKVFYLYPHAAVPKLDKPGFAKVTDDPTTVNEVQLVIEGEVLPAVIPPEPKKDLPSMGLRETLTEMADCPRELPEALIALALQTEQALRDQAVFPPEIPMVKSVVSAHLLTMAQNRNLDAISEVFDAIDGKLVETLQMLGDDLYITIYSDTAPPGAYINGDGVMQLEAPESQNMWANKLGKE